VPVSSDLRSKAGERGTVSGSSFFLISASDPGQPAYIDAQSCSPCGPCSRRGDLPRSCGVRLTVFDILGRVVTVLVTGRMEAGHHTVRFDASGLASGVYLYQMRVRTTDFRAGRPAKQTAGRRAIFYRQRKCSCFDSDISPTSRRRRLNSGWRQRYMPECGGLL